MYSFFLTLETVFSYIKYISTFASTIFHFFCFYFTSISLWSLRDTFYNIVWYDFIANYIQYHYNIRYRKFSLNSQVDSPELSKTPEITEMTENFRGIHLALTKLHAALEAATRGVPWEKVFLRKFHKIHRKLPAPEPLFNKVTGLMPSTLLKKRSTTWLKKRLWHKCFPVNFAKFLRTPFLQNGSGRLLLKRFKTRKEMKRKNCYVF